MGLHKIYDSKEATAKYLRRNPGMSLVARDNKKIIGALLCGHDGRRFQGEAKCRSAGLNDFVTVQFAR